MVASIPNDVFQFSTYSALKAGFNQGQPSAADLTSHGDHGIGTFEDGSLMLLIDSKAYMISQDGKPELAPSHARLPFAMVTIFMPRFRLNDQTQRFGLEDFEQLLPRLAEGGVGGPNSVLPFKVEGKFNTIVLEVNGDQSQTHSGVWGTVFGYVVPSWMSQISGPRYHCHFVSDKIRNGPNAAIGGCVLDFDGEATPSLGKCGRFHLGLPQGAEWETMNLS